MAIKDLFNKAAKGVKTLFKKDGLIQSTFNKGSAVFDKGSSLVDKAISTGLNIGGQIGRTARDLAPALAAFNPALGATKLSNFSLAINSKFNCLVFRRITLPTKSGRV